MLRRDDFYDEEHYTGTIETIESMEYDNPATEAYYMGVLAEWYPDPSYTVEDVDDITDCCPSCGGMPGHPRNFADCDACEAFYWWSHKNIR